MKLPESSQSASERRKRHENKQRSPKHYSVFELYALFYNSIAQYGKTFIGISTLKSAEFNGGVRLSGYK